MNSRGFVLASCLWVVALIFLILSAFESFVSDELDLAQLKRERLKEEIDMVSTEEMVRHLLSVHRITISGLDWGTDLSEIQMNEEGLVSRSHIGSELRLDGTVYAGMGNVLFSLQDENGLIPLNSGGSWVLDAFAQSLGLSAIQREQVFDQLRDFTDADDFKRLNGAESSKYVSMGLPAPENDWIRLYPEVKDVMSWKEYIQTNGANIPLDFFSTRLTSTVNMNTMPHKLLGYFVEDIEAFSSRRKQAPYYNIEELKSETLFLKNGPDALFNIYPDRFIRLTLWIPGRIQRREIGLELTPFGFNEPILERYRFDISAGYIKAISPEDLGITLQQRFSINSEER